MRDTYVDIIFLSIAINRVHRIGQRNETHVYRYLINETIEHRIHGLSKNRRLSVKLTSEESHERNEEMDHDIKQSPTAGLKMDRSGELVADYDVQWCLFGNDTQMAALYEKVRTEIAEAEESKTVALSMSSASIRSTVYQANPHSLGVPLPLRAVSARDALEPGIQREQALGPTRLVFDGVRLPLAVADNPSSALECRITGDELVESAVEVDGVIYDDIDGIIGLEDLMDDGDLEFEAQRERLVNDNHREELEERVARRGDGMAGGRRGCRNGLVGGLRIR
jgi:hypothetical protein